MAPTERNEGALTLPEAVVEGQVHRFDKHFSGVRRKLVSAQGESFARDVLFQTRSEYRPLLQAAPLFRGRVNVFNEIIQLNARVVAFYRAMKAHDQSVEDVVRIYYDLFDELHSAIPRPARWAARQVVFSPLFLHFAQRSSALVSDHPGGWDIRFRRGDGRESDWSFECSRCGVIAYYEQNDAMELAPFCNFFDYIQSKTFGMGMWNPTSLGRGDTTCVELMKRGRETALPDNLRSIVTRSA